MTITGVSAISIFVIENFQKCSLFYQKSSFCPQNFQIFVLPSTSLFFPSLTIADFIEEADSW